MKGRLDGTSLRVPVPTGSITDVTATLKKKAPVDDINAVFSAAAKKGDLKGILKYTEDPIVSSDIVGDPHSSIFDAGMTMSMAKEFGSRGVTVNAVAPGFIESDMTAELPEAIVEGVMKNIPAGRFGKPEEVADLVKFLALEDGALYITGHCLNIDGGLAIGTC